jgi:hypothetical protein
MVKHLPSNCRALSLNPRSIKINNKNCHTLSERDQKFEKDMLILADELVFIDP